MYTEALMDVQWTLEGMIHMYWTSRHDRTLTMSP